MGVIAGGTVGGKAGIGVMVRCNSAVNFGVTIGVIVVVVRGNRCNSMGNHWGVTYFKTPKQKPTEI